MALIGPVVKNDIFFFITILALAAAMMLLEWRKRRAPKTDGLEGAALRKAQWTARRERLWMTASCAASCLFILLITAEFIYAREATALSAATPVTFENGAVRIPVASVSDGNLHRFVSRRSGRSRALHRDPEARSFARRRARCLPDLRHAGLLPEGPGSDLPELRFGYRDCHHRHAGRLQSDSPEVARRRRHAGDRRSGARGRRVACFARADTGMLRPFRQGFDPPRAAPEGSDRRRGRDGSAVATSMLGVMLVIGDKVNRELRRRARTSWSPRGRRR